MVMLIYPTFLFTMQGPSCCCDRKVVEFTITHAIATKVVNMNPAHEEVYSIQHYVTEAEKLLKVALNTIKIVLNGYFDVI